MRCVIVAICIIVLFACIYFIGTDKSMAGWPKSYCYYVVLNADGWKSMVRSISFEYEVGNEVVIDQFGNIVDTLESLPKYQKVKIQRIIALH